MSSLMSSILLLMASFERGIWVNLQQLFFIMIFAIFNTDVFTSVSRMVYCLPCFVIRYATSYNVMRIGLSMGTMLSVGSVTFSSNLSLFTVNSASVVFLYFPSPFSFRKCSLSFYSTRIAQIVIANQGFRTLTPNHVFR